MACNGKFTKYSVHSSDLLGSTRISRPGHRLRAMIFVSAGVRGRRQATPRLHCDDTLAEVSPIFFAFVAVRRRLWAFVPVREVFAVRSLAFGGSAKPLKGFGSDFRCRGPLPEGRG